jgi:hypothetical protein
MLSVIYAKCRNYAHYDKCHIADSYYAECRYAECRVIPVEWLL